MADLPVLVNPYTTLLAVQQETRNNKVPSQTALLNAINLASRAIDEYCFRDWLYHDFTTTPFRAPKADVIGKTVWMRYPIVSISNINVNGVDVDASDYYFEPGNYEIEYTSGAELDDWYAIGGSAIDMPQVNWTQGPIPGPSGWGGYPGERSFKPTPILISGIFGYEVPDSTQPPVNLPAFIFRAATLIAAAWSDENRKEAVNQSGGVAALFDSKIPDEAMKIMNRYRWQKV